MALRGRHSGRWRWLPSVVTIGAVAGAVAIPAALRAGPAAHPVLPARTAGQLLAAVAGERIAGLSGTVHTSADFGLPSLPTGDTALGSNAAGTLTGLLSGSRTAQIWMRGSSDERVAVLGKLEETELVRNGRNIWTYNSATAKATHTVLAGNAVAPAAPDDTPQQLAQALLTQIDPDTVVSVDRTAEVAGRRAYTLVLTPSGGGTLIGRISIAVDAVTGLPLQVSVDPASSTTPAVQIGFTSLSYAVPAASHFDYSAPPGAALTTTTLTAPSPGAPRSGVTGSLSTIGTGWTAVERIRLPALPAQEQEELALISTRVPQGELISTRLLSILITPNNVVYAGAVPGKRLETVASTGAA